MGREPGNADDERPVRRRAGADGARVLLVVMLLAVSCSSGGDSSEKPRATAPASARVDLVEPTFSNPTSITNPLFPVSMLARVVQLGEEDGEPVRVEITLLPGTRTITWNGRAVETRISQFVAHSDGEIVEAAVDFFAQADDGSVWYFGEEVDNYRDGVIANHSGSWLAGRDGPPGMIMPATPKKGAVYRPENIPGLVFEEVIVRSVDETLDGPRGPVGGVALVREFLMEGTTEDKAFAPGYGEFRARAEDELVTVAAAVPTDAVPAPVPAELREVTAGAVRIFDAAASNDWTGIAAMFGAVSAAAQTLRAGQLPPLLADACTRSLEALSEAIGARKAADVRRAATDVLGAALDLELRHRPVLEVDVDRMALWARRVLVDATAEEAGRMAGGVATLETIWKRVRHAVDATAAGRVDANVKTLRKAADEDDTRSVPAAVPALLQTLASLRPGL